MNPSPLRNMSRRREQGMVMLVGLILLVILTVVAVIGFRNVTMSERMAGNSVDRNVSLQAAESSGKEAFQVIELNATNAGLPSTTSGYYDNVTNSATTMATNGGNTSYWTQGAGSVISPTSCGSQASFNWTSCSASVPTVYANNSQAAQYVIERISSNSSGGSTVTIYRVTTRSVGGSGNAEVVLQTLYTKSTTP